MKLARVFATILALGVMSISNANDPILFVSFKDPGKGGVWFALSEDGYNWEALNNAEAWIKPDYEGETMRDPFIARGPEGDFHLVWTTARRKIGYAHSEDLVSWSKHRQIQIWPEDDTSIRNTWAPEIYYDKEAEDWLIIWSTTIIGKFPETMGTVKNDMNHRIYGAKTKDFITSEKPFLFFDPGYPVIDASLIEYEGGYYMCVKDERSEPLHRYLLNAKAPSLLGPYKTISEPFTASYTEGPSILKQGDEYLIYYDKYSKPQEMQVAKTKDFVTMEDVTPQTSFPDKYKHGSFIRVTEEEAEALKAR